MTIIEYSTTCLRGPDWREKLSEAQKLVEAAGLKFGVQIHNCTGLEDVKKLVDWRPEGVQFSVHSPVLAEHFLNLASPDRECIEETLERCLPVLTWAETDLLFFHGFFLTDKRIVHDMANYRRVMLDAMGGDYSLDGTFIMNPAVFETDAYIRHKKILKDNILWLKNRLPNYRIALENDYPGIGTALQRPTDIVDLVDNLWLDLGHLWVSSLVHKFDFYEAIDQLLEKVNVVGVHITHNFSTPDMPLERLKDSHGHLYIPSTQNLAPVVRKFRDFGVPILTLEVVDGNSDDLRLLLQWLGAN